MQHYIQFEFVCIKPVPLYEYLCQQFAKTSLLPINYGIINEPKTVRYILEAYAEQAQLEALADDIAHQFLLSVWLIESKITRVESPQFSSSTKQVHQKTQAPLLFCQHCQPQFGDNQSPHFGNIHFPCPHCQGETKLSFAQTNINQQKLDSLVEQILTQTSVVLPSEHLRVSINEVQAQRTNLTGFNLGSRLLICNPNVLNAYFKTDNEQVMALSSIEKPIITLVSNSEQTATDNHQGKRYEVQFAYTRVLQVICEKLRQRGVNWLYVMPTEQATDAVASMRLARVNQHWIEINQSTEATLTLKSPCLHDYSVFSLKQMQYQASGKASFSSKQSKVSLSIQRVNEQSLSNLDEQHVSHKALLAGVCERYPSAKNTAILFFSQEYQGEIATVDSQEKFERFLAFNAIPNTGYDICHQLFSSRQGPLLIKFKQRFPELYTQLLELKFEHQTANLSSLLILASIIIGFSVDNTSVVYKHQQYLDSIISAAQYFRGNNAPRVDFPLVKGEAIRSIDWCKTLGTLISFKIAGEQDNAKLAYAFFDSFADYLSNWLEHIDLNQGISQVVLAGSEFSYPPLARFIERRVGKNFPLIANPYLDLEGANIAIGGLLLPIRNQSRLINER